MRRTYELIKNGIKCLKCSKTSYNPHDVANLFCGSCKFHNPYDTLYEDVFGHAFIYDERYLNEDSSEMHENLKAGKWRILRICLSDNQPDMNKMSLYAMLDPTLIVHEIGGSEGVAYITQKEMTDSEVSHFKKWFERTLVFGSCKN